MVHIFSGSKISGMFTVLTEHSPEDLTAFFRKNQLNYFGVFKTPDLDLFENDQIKSKTPTDFNMIGRWTLKETLCFLLDVSEDEEFPTEVKQRLDGMTVEIDYEEYDTDEQFAHEGIAVVKAIYDKEKDRLETKTVRFRENELPFTAETLVNRFGLDNAWDTFTDYGRRALAYHMIADPEVPELVRQFLEIIDRKDDKEAREKFFNNVFDRNTTDVYDVYTHDFIESHTEAMREYAYSYLLIR